MVRRSTRQPEEFETKAWFLSGFFFGMAWRSLDGWTWTKPLELRVGNTG